MIVLLLACCLAFPAEVTVDTDTLTLGALGAFPKGDARAAIALGRAPAPGLARRILKYEILNKVTAAGLKADDLELPDSVLVRRKAQVLDPEAVKEIVQNAFAKQYPDAIINIISVDVPAVEVATGELDLNATIPDRIDMTGPIFVRLDIKSPGFSRSVFVRTAAEIMRPQPVMRSSVAAHSTVRKDDLEWKVMPQGKGQPIRSADGLGALAAKRDLKAGEILTEDLLYSPLLVRKGESVTVKVTNGGITISAMMRAKAAGHLGETISLEHITGTGTTSARVIGPGLLEALQGAK